MNRGRRAPTVSSSKSIFPPSVAASAQPDLGRSLWIIHFDKASNIPEHVMPVAISAEGHPGELSFQLAPRWRKFPRSVHGFAVERCVYAISAALRFKYCPTTSKIQRGPSADVVFYSREGLPDGSPAGPLPPRSVSKPSLWRLWPRGSYLVGSQ